MARWILCIFLALFAALDAKAPQLVPRDVKSKVEEILKAHATYKKLTPELIERTLQNYLEELDPAKMYFLENEISPWTKPREDLCQKILTEFSQSDFSEFQKIQSIFESAVARRNQIEENLASTPLPAKVSGDEFKDLSYTSTSKELEERILRLKALQMQAAEKISAETKDLFFQRLQKRRLNREAELLDSDKEERQKIIFSLILKAMTSALDSHTNYFTPGEANQFMIQVQQRLFGIGAQLRDRLDGFSIVRLLENSPASQCPKLKINDRIIAVNKEPVVGLDIADAVELIRGEKGTPVVLTVIRETGEGQDMRSETFEVELIRNEVVLEESRLETSLEPFGDGVIASLKLFSFYQDPRSSSASDIRKAIDAIKKEHKLQGVILDLRGNAGGLLPQAVAVTGVFINKGVVVSIRDHSGRVQHLRETEGKPAWTGPLAVLVNRASASAAEIVAQTLQDYGRSITIGDDHTFGKGTYQTFTLDPTNNPDVNPQGEYKVTRGRYYTVSGKSPQLVGVSSDIVVPGMLSYLDIGEKFSKYPLENDQIDPHFEDNLSDLSPFYRLQLGPMYRYNLQKKIDLYQPLLPMLRKNSETRISGNKNYQNFIQELQKKNFDSELIDLFGNTDLQFVEASNILKDLIFLMRLEEAKETAALAVEAG